MKCVATLAATVIGLLVPVMAAVTVSVAVRVCSARRLQGDDEGADAAGQRAVGGQRGLAVGGAELDDAGVARGRVAEGILVPSR